MDWTTNDFEEGGEPEEFWSLLGGKTGYLNPDELQGVFPNFFIVF